MKRLPLYILLACFLGAVAGLLFPAFPLFSWIGDLFLRLLKMIVVPIVAVSLLKGVWDLGDVRKLKRLGMATLLYYLLTSSFSIATGLFLVNLIHPGRLGLVGGSVEKTELPSVGELILRIVPENPFRALAEGEMLAVIFFSLLLGIVCLSLGEEALPSFRKLVDEGFYIIMKLTHGVLWTAPVGIGALVAEVFQQGGWETLQALGAYFLTVAGGLFFHAFFTLPLILWFLARRNPFAYFAALSPALLTAFSTASSQATLPLTMECAEKGGKIPPTVASFVLPLGATINMDGTALYEAVAAIFIAQCYGISLSLPEQAMIFLTALLVSIGAAGIPMAGLVMMTVVLESVGLPVEGIGLILGVDRFLDMLRTSVNVWSDGVGSAVMARLFP